MLRLQVFQILCPHAELLMFDTCITSLGLHLVQLHTVTINTALGRSMRDIKAQGEARQLNVRRHKPQTSMKSTWDLRNRLLKRFACCPSALAGHGGMSIEKNKHANCIYHMYSQHCMPLTTRDVSKYVVVNCSSSCGGSALMHAAAYKIFFPGW